jgi:adenylate cyclase
VSQEAADTFIRYEAGEETFEIPIERLSICGIGRAKTNVVVIPDTMASREHAIIRRNASGNCVLNDLGSTNGTWLNGRAVTTPTELRSGDVINIGQHRFDFVQTGETVAPEVPHTRTLFFVEQQLVSVLVVDVRGYTSMAAQMGSERTAEMMGDIFREAGALLNGARCWSTKYIGDAIMALWVHADSGMVRGDIVNAFDVISAYQEIFRMAERKHQPPVPLRFGCGYSAGMASIGNIGSAGAADFTAMGETVNTAFRLESATKEIACDVLIERAVFESLSDVQALPPDLIELALKGYDQPTWALPLRFEDLSGFVSALLSAS